MYYLASNRPLPLVHGDEHFPAFAVSTIGEDEELRIRSVIASPFIYYLASWQGCSCGFCYEEDPEVQRELAGVPDEATRAMCLDSLQGGYNSVHSLARYLRDHIQGGPLLLYIAWAGCEGAAIEHHWTITPGYFEEAEVASFPEDSLVTIVPAQSVHEDPASRWDRGR